MHAMYSFASTALSGTPLPHRDTRMDFAREQLLHADRFNLFEIDNLSSSEKHKADEMSVMETSLPKSMIRDHLLANFRTNLIQSTHLYLYMTPLFPFPLPFTHMEA